MGARIFCWCEFNTHTKTRQLNLHPQISTLTLMCACSHALSRTHTQMRDSGRRCAIIVAPKLTFESMSFEKGRSICRGSGNPSSMMSDPLTVGMWPVNPSVLLIGRCKCWYAVASLTEGTGGGGCQLEILQRLSLLEFKLRNKKFVFLTLRNRKWNLHAKAFHGHYLS